MTDHAPLTDEEQKRRDRLLQFAKDNLRPLTDEEFEEAPLIARYGTKSEIGHLCLRLIANLRSCRAEVERLRRELDACKDQQSRTYWGPGWD